MDLNFDLNVRNLLVSSLNELHSKKRNARDQTGQIEENASDIQYLMQAFTGIEDRLSKIESSAGDQGTDPRMV